MFLKFLKFQVFQKSSSPSLVVPELFDSSFLEKLEETKEEEITFLDTPIKHFPRFLEKFKQEILSTPLPIPQSNISEENKFKIKSRINHLVVDKLIVDSEQSIELIRQTHPTFVSLSQPLYSPKSFSPKTNILVVQTMDNQPPNKMDAIIAAKYAPLVMPQNLNPFLADYLKYIPRFNGEEDITVKEHLTAYYSFADNFNIEHADVWVRVFFSKLGW